jgi:hypothetical protein
VPENLPGLPVLKLAQPGRIDGIETHAGEEIEQRSKLLGRGRGQESESIRSELRPNPPDALLELAVDDLERGLFACGRLDRAALGRDSKTTVAECNELELVVGKSVLPQIDQGTDRDVRHVSAVRSVADGADTPSDCETDSWTNARQSRKLLLPAPFFPTRTVKGSRSTTARPMLL